MFSCSVIRVLVVVSLYFSFITSNRISKFFPQTRQNALKHNTLVYETVHEGSGHLVLRRGQPFEIGMELESNFDEEKDDIDVFATPMNTVLKKYKAKAEEWDFNWDSEDILKLEIIIPANASIGRYKLEIHLRNQNSKKVEDHNIIEETIILVANPWNKSKYHTLKAPYDVIFSDDTVYLNSDAKLNEYILNDVGDVYMGHPKNRYPKPWFYGQVNSNDNLGVLVGKWDGKYDPHKHPMHWISSGPILEEYHKSNGVPVRYGQCWVYAAVLTTMCRALGIPNRPVTDFGAAHDKNHNLAVDKYFKKVNGKPVEVQSELIWNFHVWNEVWIDRPDLPEGYSGWQVIDGTPQEMSDDLYRCGPLPIKAAKYGEMGTKFDAPFIYAEVNADIINWLTDDTNSSMSKMSSNTRTIGQSILTKAIEPIKVGKKFVTYEDLTDYYKFAEGTKEERKYLKKAADYLNLSYIYEEPKGRALRDEIEIRSKLFTDSEPMIGEPLKVIVAFTNKMNKLMDIYINVNITSMYYTGIVAHQIMSNPSVFMALNPQQTRNYKIYLSVEEYLEKLVDFAMVKVNIVAHGKNTNDFWNEEYSVQFQRPKLNMRIIGDAKVNEFIALEVGFKNPLDKTLTGCALNIAGRGLFGIKTVPIPNIKPKKLFRTFRHMTSRSSGRVSFLGSLNCNEIHDINGELIVDVQK